MKKAFYILTAVIVFILAACTASTTGADAIDRAENAIAAGDHNLAQRCADSLIHNGTQKLSKLRPSQLCRLALIYKKLADNALTSEEANTSTALKLYKMAFSQNADSVIVFRRSLTLDDAAAFEVLSSLHAMTDAPVDLEAEEPLDSIGIDTTIYQQPAATH